jgi:hypothetical protein
MNKTLIKPYSIFKVNIVPIYQNRERFKLGLKNRKVFKKLTLHSLRPIESR